jgi:hypothetical protein
MGIRAYFLSIQALGDVSAVKCLVNACQITQTSNKYVRHLSAVFKAAGAQKKKKV